MPSPRPRPETHAGNKGSNDQQVPPPLAVTIVEPPEAAVASQRREAEGREHDAKDLDAQIRAADAAEEQVLLGWGAAAISLIGTGLIVWTLYETRRGTFIARREYGRARVEGREALEIARQALIHSEAAASAAEASARYQREAVRPFFVPVDYGLRRMASGDGSQILEPPGYVFDTKVMNIGGGPGFVRRFGVGHVIAHDMPQSAPLGTETDLVGNWFIRPDGTRDFGLGLYAFQITEDQAKAIQKNRLNLYVFGYLEFIDGFGVRRRTWFCYELYAAEPEGENLVVAGSYDHWREEEMAQQEPASGGTT